MYPTLNIGPFAFPSAGLIIIFGAYLALWVVEKAGLRLKQNHTRLYNLATVGLLSGFIGARLAFVIEYWAAFRENLLGIVWPLNSGYTTWAGVFIGITAAFFYGRFHKLSLWHTLDAIFPAVVVGFMVVSLADFFGGPGFGTLTAMPWGVSQFGIRRHAVQLYEIAAGAAALGIWWTRSRQARSPGQLFWWGTAVYSAGRLFVQAFRENAWLTPNGYHVPQIIYLIILLGALLFLSSRSELR